MRKHDTLTEEQFAVFGFRASVHRDRVDPPSSHQHNNVELALVENEWITCLLGGSLYHLPPDRFAVFWGARPHLWLNVKPGSTRRFIDLPLSWFLSWELPERLTRRILSGEMVIEQRPEQEKQDLALFKQWCNDLSEDTPGKRKVVILEIQARLWRLAWALGAYEDGDADASKAGGAVYEAGHAHGELNKVVEMASYIVENYMHPLNVQEIAGSVGLHPNYAMTLFHHKTGLTIMDYVTRQRVSHAQLLLATTDAKIVDVAFHAGFGSVSRFYSAFKSSCGMKPSEYRRCIYNQ